VFIPVSNLLPKVTTYICEQALFIDEQMSTKPHPVTPVGDNENERHIMDSKSK